MSCALESSTLMSTAFSDFLVMANPFLGRDYRKNMPELLQGSKDWSDDREKENTACAKENGVCTNRLDYETLSDISSSHTDS